MGAAGGVVGPALTLADVLGASERSRSSRQDAQFLLDFPWCWPPDEPLASRARQLRPEGPPGADRGEALLVAVREGIGGVAVLGRGGVPLVGAALRAWDTANLVLSRDFGGWLVPHGVRRACPPCRFIGPPTFATELDGPSFGGAMLAAVASWLLNRPLPVDVAVLTEVAPDGQLRRVDGLEAKLRALRDWTPAVRRCVVAPEQANEAALLSEFEVLRLSSAHELLHELLPGDPQADPGERARRLFFVTAANGRPRLTWKRIKDEAAAVAGAVGLSSEDRWRAQVAASIAARHEGQPGLPWPMDYALAGLPRVLRDNLVAQRVQHLTDAGDGGWEDIEAVHQRLPPPREASSEELKIAGAVGRALARRREYEKAEPLLRELVVTWFDAGRPLEANHPLTEWARVAGIRGRRELLADDIEPRAWRLHDAFSAEERGEELGLLALAMGRAWVQLEDVEAAGRWWATADWAHVEGWVSAAAERWQARGQWQRGECDEAVSRLRAVRGPEDISALAVLDAHILDGGDGTASLEAFLATGGRQETAWLLSDAGSPREMAQRLFKESPY